MGLGLDEHPSPTQSGLLQLFQTDISGLRLAAKQAHNVETISIQRVESTLCARICLNYAKGSSIRIAVSMHLFEIYHEK